MTLSKAELQKIDPLKKQPELSAEEFAQSQSPMSPPDATKAPGECLIPENETHPMVKNFVQEHKELTVEINKYKVFCENLKIKMKLEEEQLPQISSFFQYFEENFISHNRDEERYLFPLLKRKLIKNGEHSPTTEPITGIDVLEDEHLQALQLSTLITHFFELSLHLKDEYSKKMVFNKALRYSFDLIELLELHIYREDNIIFGLAHNLLTKEELDDLHSKMQM